MNDEIYDLANRVLAPRQLEVFILVHKHGMSQRGVSYKLDCGKTNVSDALDGAYRRLRRNGVMFTPDGRPYLAEQEPA